MPIDILISPHPDDIALSIGDYVHKRTDDKLLVTTHSESADDDFLAVTTDFRLKEEIAFAGKVRAKLMCLNLPDTNFRKIPWYPFSNCIERGGILQLASQLSGILGKLRGVNLYSPLSIGLHPDHLECLYATMVILKEKSEILNSLFFYEDVPYSLSDYSRLTTQDKILQLGIPISHPYDPVVKKTLLDTYPTQISHELKNRIFSTLRFESLFEIKLPLPTFFQQCTVDSLAIADGIRLI